MDFFILRGTLVLPRDSSMGIASVLAGTALAVYITRLCLKYYQVVRSVGNLPGFTTLITPLTPLSNTLPPIPFINVGTTREIKTRYADFAASGHDAYAHYSIWPEPCATLFVADPSAIKEITTHRARFPKPVEIYSVLTFFGNNIIASKGEEWKRYRKVCAPAFSERNNKLVWDESIRIVNDMIGNVWKHADIMSFDHVVDMTLPLALFVIGVAGFGRRMSFTEELEVPAGFTMNFKDALHVVSGGVIIKLAIPKRALGLTQRFREVNLAFNELEMHMKQMIYSRKLSEKEEERHDLFSNLLDAANDDTDGEPKLADSELVGNIFIFLLAGHETTAHTLAFCFALLALYPDKQEKLFQDITRITTELGRLPAYEDMPLFTYSMAVFYETLRIQPPVVAIPKYSEEDTTLNVLNAEGRRTTIPIPKGTGIAVHTPGLHNNPRYWNNPYEFLPERFLADYNRDAFLPFSAGARACLGRRFFETEGMAILTILMSQYRVEVKEDPKYAGETHEQRRARLFKSAVVLTTTPVNVPLTFKRRA
ncbi:614 534 cytochrome P450 [Peniophora sp. CONT]|nr:614 534 cytochrome P450 [Peniophora sp. CONT]